MCRLETCLTTLTEALFFFFYSRYARANLNTCKSHHFSHTTICRQCHANSFPCHIFKKHFSTSTPWIFAFFCHAYAILLKVAQLYFEQTAWPARQWEAGGSTRESLRCFISDLIRRPNLWTDTKASSRGGLYVNLQHAICTSSWCWDGVFFFLFEALVQNNLICVHSDEYHKKKQSAIVYACFIRSLAADNNVLCPIISR